MINGCVGADKGIGAFTLINTTGKSVVDYVIYPPQVLPLISKFSIQSELPESDHLPMEFSLRYPTTSDIHNQPRSVPIGHLYTNMSGQRILWGYSMVY